MNATQFKKLLTSMESGINPVIPHVKFDRTPGQASITDLIDCISATGDKLWQEYTKFNHIHFNTTGAQANKFIEALNERTQNMGWNYHTTLRILMVSYGNRNNINLFDN